MKHLVTRRRIYFAEVEAADEDEALEKAENSRKKTGRTMTGQMSLASSAIQLVTMRMIVHAATERDMS